MSYWLEMAKVGNARSKAQRLASQFREAGADLRGVVLIEAARADRIAAKIAEMKQPFADNQP